jgi:uncharacterized protein YqjF (DUF2071 family)
VISACAVHTHFSVTNNKKLQMVMRDMLFITWAVEPELVRKVVDERLDLDMKTDSNGEVIAFVSAVCFHVTELRSSGLPLPSMSFQQVNYRACVRAGEVPAVFFLEMKVNSRMVTSLTSFLSVPVYYEDIDITTSPADSGLLRYSVTSGGLRAEAMIGGHDQETVSDAAAPPRFITQRLVGYAGAGNGMFRIDVEQPELESILARVQNVRAPSLERLGLLTPDQSAQPYSALYVREGLFGADTPVREW